jgi:site-specific DNA recombinase
MRARAVLTDCNTKLARHRAALEAGADPTIVTGWIAEVEADRREAMTALNRPTPRPARRMTREQIRDLVTSLGEIIGVLREADPADRAEVYQQLGLHLTYHPDSRSSAYGHNPTRTNMGNWLVSEGGAEPPRSAWMRTLGAHALILQPFWLMAIHRGAMALCDENRPGRAGCGS